MERAISCASSAPSFVSRSASASCTLATGQTLTGFAVGDFVEMECVLRLGVWMVRDIRHEDDQVANPPNDDDDSDTGDTDDSDDNSDDGDDHDNSGPGGGGHSGHGGGDD